MAHTHTKRCEELQEALQDARSRQSPPNRETASPGYQAVHALDYGNTTPDASPELRKQIELLEQELRDQGCEPR